MSSVTTSCRPDVARASCLQEKIEVTVCWFSALYSLCLWLYVEIQGGQAREKNGQKVISCSSQRLKYGCGADVHSQEVLSVMSTGYVSVWMCRVGVKRTGKRS